jgi:hypothetical protein
MLCDGNFLLLFHGFIVERDSLFAGGVSVVFNRLLVCEGLPQLID